ncbi:ABC transporter ATP-binding protein [Bombiscardovia coagulans]|uniref:ABC transporter, ATP binding protein n=1 Tax=Bombiscardovia coagulans TaxID=686666 RepID=A0A261ETR8_9BIFI|nr:ABC transporter ATP-binding protein [Bombiscardovia coagulans]OZG50264.1 ABC transporter, ATP binding protein [Bombiscardovia coagulans]
MLEVNGISFTYEDHIQPTLTDLSFQLASGEVLCLTGKSGCGKTTVSRFINGLIPELYEGQKEGNCQLEGTEIASLPMYQLSQRVGSVFQNPKTQFFTTDVTSELAFPLENLGVDRERIRSRIAEVAELFDISHLLDRSMFALSGGEKQMVAIASSYMLNPALLLLDEPSSNLDAQAVETLAGVLGKLKVMGLAMVVIEHRLYYLRDLADRFLVMDKGKAIQEFSSEQMASLSQDTRQQLGLRALSFGQEGEELHKPSSSVVSEGEHPTTRPHQQAEHNIGGSATIPEMKLQLSHLTYTYKGGHTPALTVEHLELSNREVVGIVGCNGAGKSTFARVLTGLLKAKAGAVFQLNEQTMSDHDVTRESFLVFQDVNYQLFSESVGKELLLGAPEQAKDQLDEVAHHLGLTELLNCNPNTLSGGQKQRVAVGCAVLSGKRIVIMDEPTSGLDLMHMQQVTQAIEYLHRLGKIVLVISHDREFLLKTCSRYVTFNQGRVVRDKPTLD